MTGPLVSIVVNNYNYARFLRRAVDSALAQTYPNIEVLVVDDGSSDESPRVIAEYGNRITPILKTNGGQGSAMNAGFAQARGQWISYLDADDALMPNCVERVMQAIGQHRGNPVAKCHYRMRVIDEHDALVGEQTALDQSVAQPTGDLRNTLRKNGTTRFPPTTGNLFSRTVMEKIMPIPEPEFRLCADAWLCTAAPLFGDVVAVEEPLAQYRSHGQNSFSRRGIAHDGLLSAVRKRAEMFEAIALLYRRFEEHFDPSVLDKGDALAAMARLAMVRLNDNEGAPSLARRITRLTWRNKAIPLHRRAMGILWSWSAALLWRSAAHRVVNRMYGGHSQHRPKRVTAGAAPAVLPQPAAGRTQ